jgi:hypothetical protein
MSNFERTEVTENEIDAQWATFGPPPVLSSENKELRFKKLTKGRRMHYI